MEKWLPVLGYEGLYEVSDQGSVRSSPRPGTRGGRLRPDRSKAGGYPAVRLCRDGVKVHRTVHGLVARAFLGPRPDDGEVRHLNGDPADNRLENLRWGTSQENSNDMVKHGRAWKSKVTQCPQGHPYDSANTYLYQGRRYCRACGRRRSAARMQRVRVEARKRRNNG